MHILSVKYSEERQGYSSHHHDAHELLYIVSGKISVNIGGEEWVAESGSLLIFNRFEDHSIRILTEEYRRYALLISSEISQTADNYLLTSVLVNRSPDFRHIINCGESRATIESLLEDMLTEFSLKRPIYEKALSSSLIRILIELYRISPKLFLSAENRNTEIVREIQSRFECNFSEQFALRSLAAEYHVSASHLAHIFKQITGYSPIEYLMSCRLSAAKNMLSASEKSIKEIIDLCGYSDESNFSRMFKTRVGLTPTEFRRQNFHKLLDK